MRAPLLKRIVVVSGGPSWANDWPGANPSFSRASPAITPAADAEERLARKLRRSWNASMKASPEVAPISQDGAPVCSPQDRVLVLPKGKISGPKVSKSTIQRLKAPSKGMRPSAATEGGPSRWSMDHGVGADESFQVKGGRGLQKGARGAGNCFNGK